MSGNEPISALDISASALSAQRTRMNVIARNIANAQTLVTPEGGPYRRREVTFASVVNEEMKGSDEPGGEVGGVAVESVRVAREPLKTVYDPQHPHADEKGFVRMPNVNVTQEMVEMVQAQRAYEANLAAMQVYRNMSRSSFQMLK